MLLALTGACEKDQKKQQLLAKVEALISQMRHLVREITFPMPLTFKMLLRSHVGGLFHKYNTQGNSDINT